MFVYAVNEAGTTYTTNGTANTEQAWLALKQATHGFWMTALRVIGKGSALTTLNAIAFHVRRWTTAGSGGTAVTPTPVDPLAPASATTAAMGTPTAGTVSGVIVLAGVGCSATGPGGWTARDDISKPAIRSGADELDTYSLSATISLNFTGGCDFEE